MHKLQFSIVIWLILLLLAHHNAKAQNSLHTTKMNSPTKTKTLDTTRIVVLLYEGVVLQDFAGPIEVFSKAKKLTKGKYEIFTIAMDTVLIGTENKVVKIKPDFSLNEMPNADYLVIPGASMPIINQLVESNTYTDFITEWNQKPKTKTLSICTGAYLLAETKALNGKKATTHYFVADDFSKQYPKIKLVRNVRFVDEEKYITSSGITSGIDASLYIVEKHSGKRIKDMINRALQYDYQEKKDWPVAPNGMKYTRKD
ncbi:DJ-1/PfpI family protein [Muricauda sp. SCSIO 64092]|uniref:DJ-1/PfpI family protein n=1 Tax=Allomuricauda sp. SCSIO 64092 TaxID=2908842 RepID=UPI001FF4CDE2|nr:DJ-1/PfpI family protein [Muricauda sp. SCSIO 64092]UOY07316.1 DJ-1/PfpI family protein [Muricauda sp. SCSIO 64092]